MSRRTCPSCFGSGIQFRPIEGDLLTVRPCPRGCGDYDEDRFLKEHADCDAAWRCGGCKQLVCPRCMPSAGAPDTCSTCYETEDPEDAA